jgi:hypothetical protein
VNGYEGLNLPQLLDLMRDLVVPAATAWTPQTVGWLVVAVWLAMVMLAFARNALLSWRGNRYRRSALAELKRIESRAREGQATAESLAVLLKRTALAAYPRKEVASLYGAEWADFLRHTCRRDRAVRESADELASAAYRRDVDVAALIRPARRWVEGHRA